MEAEISLSCSQDVVKKYNQNRCILYLLISFNIIILSIFSKWTLLFGCLFGAFTYTAPLIFLGLMMVMIMMAIIIIMITSSISIIGKTAFLRRFRRIWYEFQVFRFRNNNFYTEQGCQPSVQPRNLRSRCLYLCPPVRGWPTNTPRHQVPFPSSSATRKAAMEIFSD